MKIRSVIEDFNLFKEDNSRYVVGFDLQDEGNGYYNWQEIVWYKKQHPIITLSDIKEAIINEINKETDENILNGHVWNGMSIWLSSENQFNFKAAYDLAVLTNGANLPLTFKLGSTQQETEENGDLEIVEIPTYYTFNTILELSDFYITSVLHINTCLANGWNKKDNIDFNQYKNALNAE